MMKRNWYGNTKHHESLGIKDFGSNDDLPLIMADIASTSSMFAIARDDDSPVKSPIEKGSLSQILSPAGS